MDPLLQDAYVDYLAGVAVLSGVVGAGLVLLAWGVADLLGWAVEWAVGRLRGRRVFEPDSDAGTYDRALLDVFLGADADRLAVAGAHADRHAGALSHTDADLLLHGLLRFGRCAVCGGSASPDGSVDAAGGLPAGAARGGLDGDPLGRVSGRA